MDLILHVTLCYISSVMSGPAISCECFSEGDEHQGLVVFSFDSSEAKFIQVSDVEVAFQAKISIQLISHYMYSHMHISYSYHYNSL